MKRGTLAVCTLVVMVGAVIAGCGAARPSKYYQLTVPGDTGTAGDASAFPVTLMLGALTTGSHLYREDRIVYSNAGQNIGTYEYQRWAEPPTEMIQDVMVRELRGSGKYRAVNTLRSNGRGDFVLRGRLYDFREVSGSPIVARTAIEYELRDSKTGMTVWSHYYTHDEPVSGKDVTAVVAALDRNVQGIVGQVRGALEQYFTAHPVAPSATPAAQ
jgi:cholesterol transport system auxiliary component